MTVASENDIIERYDWRQIRFCHEFLLDEEPFEAACRAGYRKEEAEKAAKNILSNNDLVFLIYTLASRKGIKLKYFDEKVGKKNVDINFILTRLVRVADFNSQAVMTEDGLQMRNPNAANKAIEIICRIQGLFADKPEDSDKDCDFTELSFRDGKKILKIK